MKAKGMIKDFGIELVPQLDDMPKLVVNFELTEKDDDIKYQTMKWDGFFVKRDGSLNLNTMKCLVQMGFSGEDPIILADGTGLDISHEYFLEIEVNEQGYQNIKWINRHEGGGLQEIKKAGADALRKKFASLKIGGDIKKFLSENKKVDVVENKAPNFDSNEEIPY